MFIALTMFFIYLAHLWAKELFAPMEPGKFSSFVGYNHFAALRLAENDY